MNNLQSSGKKEPSFTGIFFSASSFLIWGLAPIYWKFLGQVPPFEILMHRIFWSFCFLLPFLIYHKYRKEFLTAIKTPKVWAILLISAVLVSSNWFVFIWAVNNDQILQTSLGYYINPLVNILLGMVFLKERLRPFQILAVGLAASGVIYLTIDYGKFPWISLFLAFSFGFYGLIRKTAPVSALTGLTIETAILFLPAFFYLYHLWNKGVGAFLSFNLTTDLFLSGTALLTAVPLLFFTSGARRIHLSTVGFLQYIAPSCTFLLAVFIYHEPISNAQIYTFILIWIALLINSIDSVLYYKKYERRVNK